MATKSSDAEINIRVTEVYNLILEGYTNNEIIRHTSRKYGVSSRTVDQYVAKARKLIKIDNSVEREQLIEEHKSKLYYLFKKNLEAGDLRECRALLESERKLFGLNEPEKNSNNYIIQGSFAYEEALKMLNDHKDE